MMTWTKPEDHPEQIEHIPLVDLEHKQPQIIWWALGIIYAAVLAIAGAMIWLHWDEEWTWLIRVAIA